MPAVYLSQHRLEQYHMRSLWQLKADSSVATDFVVVILDMW